MDADGTRVRGFKAHNQPEQYALAGSTSAKDGEGFAAIDSQVYPVQNDMAIECLA
jgi:hypothetical protein